MGKDYDHKCVEKNHLELLIQSRQWNCVALIFINQPSFTVKWTTSSAFLKDVWEHLQMATCAEKIYESKSTSLNWNLILKSLNSFLVLPLFERTVEYIFNFCKSCFLNPLSGNPTESSNTLKQCVGFCWRIVWVCVTILWGWSLKV